jgi:uncharacterized membrane protein
MTTTPGLPPEAPPPPRPSGHLRTYFLTGLVVTAPIVITLWAAYWFVTVFDRWIKPLIPDVYNPDHYLPFTVPGVGLVFALVVITFIGAFAANLVGRTILNLWERVLNRTPIVRSIYKGTKQIFQTVLSQTGTSFREVALIEWPRSGIWSIVFVSREIDGAQIGLEAGRRMYSVYVSTTPNPTSGYVMFLDTKDVHILDMPVEDALKLVISMGIVFPDTQANIDKAEAAKLLAKRRKR